MFDFESLSNDSEGKGIGKRIIVLKNNVGFWADGVVHSSNYFNIGVRRWNYFLIISTGFFFQIIHFYAKINFENTSEQLKQNLKSITMETYVNNNCLFPN